MLGWTLIFAILAIVAGALGFSQHEFFDLGDTRAQLEAPPAVKF